MSKETSRGYVLTDKKEFSNENLKVLKEASQDLYYLLNRGYHIKGASTFIGNHYMFSERQRLALTRAISSKQDILLRKDKQIEDFCSINEVNIDGFNTIITLEVALSNNIILKCMDNTIRDLAGLRGTYRVIDKTETAIDLILNELDNIKIKKANIYLDAPVSNSGRLKSLIFDKAEKFNVKLNIEVINDVDRTLEKFPNVITSDAIILNKCQSWINLNYQIIKKNINNIWCIDLSNINSL